MGSLQSINSVIVWERIFEYDEKRRKDHRCEPYVNYLAAPQRRGKERRSVFAWIFQHRKEDRGTVDFVTIWNHS